MKRHFRYLFALAGLAAGAYAFLRLGSALERFTGPGLTAGREALAWLAGAALAGAAAGFFLVPLLVREAVRFTAWVQARLFRAPAQDVVAGAIGLITGLIIAYLLRPALTPLPLVGVYLPIAASLMLGYLGWMVAVHKRDDLLGVLRLLPRPGRDAHEAGRDAPDAPRDAQGAPPGAAAPKILDTSAIIDGRIAEVSRAGFLEGPLLVPAFVLDEIRRIADSADPLKRNRGRRGLDILTAMQKEQRVPVRILERDPGGAEVDVKLVKLARGMGARIVTNDFNLNKVAALHGVQVLNVNDLANAVKPAVIPGEDMTVHVIRDGKEAGQGVGYLDDGTMIVVDGGKRHMGETIGVEVTSVIQTSAGRMIFARPSSRSPVSGS